MILPWCRPVTVSSCRPVTVSSCRANCWQIIVRQPLAEHGAWKEAAFAPEEEFLAKLKAIEGTSAIEAQEYTDEVL